MGPWNLRSAGALALVLFTVLFWRLGAASFWDPDEAHYAETTRELITSGDWWAPYYNEQPFFDKPVFFHHLQAIGMMAAGQNELGARLVPALAALALVLTTAWLGAVLISVDVGLVAALLLATNAGVFALARYAILDTVFTAFLFGGASLVSVAALRDRPRLQYPGYVLVALALMIKGPLALVLCGLSMVLAMAASTDLRRRLLSLRWLVGLAIVVAIASPWFVYMYLRFRQDFVAGYLFDENIRLYATNRFGGQVDLWFYFRILATGLLPWTALVIGRIADDVRFWFVRRKDTAARQADSVEVLLGAWTAAIVGFFTFSTFKLDHYVFPAGPALCLLCARAWNDLRLAPSASEHRGARIGLHLVGPLLVLVGVSTGYLIIVRLELGAGAIVVPAIIAACGMVIAARLQVEGGRPPRAPWLAVAALTAAFAGALVFVIPTLERQKVVPDVAHWVAGQAGPMHQVATFRLNRWNTAFRFYVDRHTTTLETVEEATAFFANTHPFYCVMLEPAYQEFVARGVPLKKVYARDGIWVTAGRALWRARQLPTRFVVVTAALPGEVERNTRDDGVRSEEQRALDEQRPLIVQ